MNILETMGLPLSKTVRCIETNTSIDSTIILTV